MGLFDSIGSILGGPGEGEIEHGADEGIKMSKEQFETAKSWLQPYQDTGTNQGLAGLKSLLENPGSITDSPWYQFSLTEGLRGLQNKALAGGKFFSGQTTRDVLKFSQGLASQEYGNEFNRRYGLAQLGQSSAASLAGAAVQTGNTLAELSFNRGMGLANAQAAGPKYGQGIGNMISGFTSFFGGD